MQGLVTVADSSTEDDGEGASRDPVRSLARTRFSADAPPSSAAFPTAADARSTYPQGNAGIKTGCPPTGPACNPVRRRWLASTKVLKAHLPFEVSGKANIKGMKAVADMRHGTGGAHSVHLLRSRGARPDNATLPGRHL